MTWSCFRPHQDPSSCGLHGLELLDSPARDPDEDPNQDPDEDDED